jgi:phage shock protein A
MLDYNYERHLAQVYGQRRELAEFVTAKKRLERQLDRRQRQFVRLDAGALKALELGREDLARLALERKRLVGEDLLALKQLIDDMQRQQTQMIANGRETRWRLERLRFRTLATKTRYTAAKAQLTIADELDGMYARLRDAESRLQRTTDEIEEKKLQADVMDELERTGVLAPIGAGPVDIDRQLRELQSGGSIDTQIARMKGELARRT